VVTKEEVLYQALLDSQLVTEEQLQQLKAAIEQKGDGVGNQLQQLGYLNEKQYISFLVKECGYHYLNLDQLELDPAAIKQIPPEVAHRLRVVPLRKSKNTLAVAMSDPFRKQVLAELEKVTVYNILPIVSRQEEIERALANYDKLCAGKDKLQPLDFPADEGVPLVERFSFDSFVVGKGNEFPYAMAVAVAKSPGENYNPLFLYSDVGLGKTHLLNAIGNYLKPQEPQVKVIYTTCEYFNAKVVAAIKDNIIERFRSAFKALDILLIDDIEFLSGRDKTQEEFFHIFNSMVQAGKQVVVTSDRPPGELSVLEKRLRSRFMGGTVANIEPPDIETRIAILNKKNTEIPIPDEVSQLLANRIQNSIRELEGSLNTLLSLNKFAGEEINLENAEKVLAEMGY
jgi:chromosomal replication initiator protein